MRRPTALAAVPLVLPVVLVLPAGPSAQAADPPGSSVVAVVSTTVTSTGAGRLQQFVPPNGPRTDFAEGEVAPTDLSASRDGSRVLDNDNDFYPPTLAVRDISGTAVASYVDFNDGTLSGSALSPSGNRIAYGDGTGSVGAGGRDVPELFVQDLIGTRRSSIVLQGLAHLSEPLFLTEDLLMLRDSAPARFRVKGLDGAPDRAVVGVPVRPAELRELVLDADGRRLAYVRDPAGDGPRTIEVVAVTVTATQAVLGPPRALVAGAVDAPAFTRDGSSVVFVDGAVGARDLASVPSAGGPSQPYGLPTPLADETGIVFGVRESSAPAAVTTGPALLQGDQVRLPLRAPADPTQSQVRVTRTAVGEAPKAFERLLPADTIYDSGHVVGRTYAYALQPVDRSGNLGPVTTTQLVATAPPSLATSDPISLSSAASGFAVRLAPAGNAPDTRYSVDARVQGAAGWTRWITLGAHTSRVFGAPAAAGVARTSSVPGQTYAFRAQAVDRFGNATPPEPSVRAVVPFDQQRGSYAGSTVTVPRAGAYGGSSTFLRTAGASVAFRSAGDRLQVIGERCPTCGAFDVVLDGRRVARVDSRAAVRSVRQVLWSSPVQRTNRVRTLLVRAVGTPGRPTVVVDALSARRYGVDARSGLTAGAALPVEGGLDSLDGRFGAYLAERRLYVVGPGFRVVSQVEGFSGAARLVMQRDGNLVAYDRADRPVFQTRTGGNGPSTLLMQNDGNLVVYRDSDGRPLWSIRSGRTS